MASRNERYQYIYGNTARTMEEPASEPRKREGGASEPQKRAKRRPRVREFNSSFTGILSFAVAMLVVICIFYLHGQAQLEQQIQDISVKRTKLASLLNENHEIQTELNKNVDYDELREYAEKNLGMTVPDEEHTIYYDGADPDYVRQYEEIPETQ